MYLTEIEKLNKSFKNTQFKTLDTRHGFQFIQVNMKTKHEAVICVFPDKKSLDDFLYGCNYSIAMFAFEDYPF